MQAILWRVALAVGLFSGSVALAVAAELSGRVSLSSEGKPLRPEEAAEAIVYFRPVAPTTMPPVDQPYSMTTQRKQFVPRILAVPVGSKVRFPNQDPILHNAFSTSNPKDNAFDAGLYGQGDSFEKIFASPGYVRVYCNVHHSMVGHILVLDTPFFTRPDANGRFRLDKLPDGPGDLVVWHDRATPWHKRLDAGEGELDIQLDLTQRKVPQHMNKFGKPYGRSSDGGY